MNLHKLILTKNLCYIAGRTIVPRGIMVHSTGANNPNISRYVGPDDGLLGPNLYGNDWNRAKNSNGTDFRKCVHGFIGKLKDGSVATYQTLPWNHRGWHAGGAANDTHISFEICEDGLTNPTYFNAVYKEAVELCVYLVKLYNIPVSNIIGHYEGHERGIASNHGDPKNWFPKFGKSMDTFRADVTNLLSGFIPEVKKMDMTGLSAKINTTYDAGLSLWSSMSKSQRLIAVPKGEIVKVLVDHHPDSPTGWVTAVYKGVEGYADKQYLVAVPAVEPPVEPPVSDLVIFKKADWDAYLEAVERLLSKVI